MAEEDQNKLQSPQEPPRKWAALCFVGPINHPWTQNLRNALCGYANDGVTDVLLLISSGGGSLTEGFALYNLMQTLPFRIHAHNIGVVQSIANIVFMAGEFRTAAPESTFLFHGFSYSFGQESLDEAQIAERSSHLVIGRAEFLRIFQARTKWDETAFAERRLFDRAVIVQPSEALNAGIVQDVLHLKVPHGVTILNVVA